MIKKNSAQKKETRENMRGGAGAVTIRHYLTHDEMEAACRLCAELTLPPGAGIGDHVHSGEDEVYIIQQGRGIVVDNGVEVAVGAGDVVLTGNGAHHAIRNCGETDLIVTAIIMQYTR